MGRCPLFLEQHLKAVSLVFFLYSPHSRGANMLPEFLFLALTMVCIIAINEALAFFLLRALEFDNLSLL